MHCRSSRSRLRPMHRRRLKRSLRIQMLFFAGPWQISDPRTDTWGRWRSKRRHVALSSGDGMPPRGERHPNESDSVPTYKSGPLVLAGSCFTLIFSDAQTSGVSHHPDRVQANGPGAEELLPTVFRSYELSPPCETRHVSRRPTCRTCMWPTDCLETGRQKAQCSMVNSQSVISGCACAALRFTRAPRRCPSPFE